MKRVLLILIPAAMESLKKEVILEESTSTVKFWKEKGKNILFGELVDNAKLTLVHAKENSQVRSKILDPANPIPYVCNIKKINSATSEAREFLAKDVAGISCAAFIVDNGMSRLIADYALLINRPLVPTKMFTSFDQAEYWVRNNGRY